MAIAHAYASLGKFIGHPRGAYIRQVEAQSRHALLNTAPFPDAINLRTAFAQDSEHFHRQSFFISTNRCQSTLQTSASGFLSTGVAQALEVLHRSVHAGHIFVDKSAGFDLSRRLIGDEILTEGRQL